jgi:hypothetical protein
MNLPEKADLPFFAYGIFKPGQLAFFQIRELVKKTLANCVISGTLLERDGLPIIDKDGSAKVKGTLIFFKEGRNLEAYERIVGIEPDKHYRWGVTKAEHSEYNGETNVLFGRKPGRGSVPFEEQEWDARKDPLFTSALEVVRETLEQNKELEWNLKPLFRLQMAYLLLWSAIERYVSLRYHLGEKVSEKVKHLAEEKPFKESLKIFVKEKRDVFKAAEPEDKITLDPSNPNNSLNYYYQIRSNITHRGKSVVMDFDKLLKSLEELYNIFKIVLNEAFKEAHIF